MAGLNKFAKARKLVLTPIALIVLPLAVLAVLVEIAQERMCKSACPPQEEDIAVV